MVRCSVYGCQNYSEKKCDEDICYFSFPKDSYTSNRWLEACKQERINIKNGRVCSVHFVDGCYDPSYFIRKTYGYPCPKNRYLKPDAIPTEYLPVCETNMPTTSETAACNPHKKDDTQCTSASDMESSRETTLISTSSQQYSALSGYISNTDEVLQLGENFSLLKRNEELTQENEDLNAILRKYFTTGQIAVMKQKTKKRIRWNTDDICAAISLRCVSPKAYRYLRNIKEYPLPAVSTLCRWVSNLNVEPGMLEDVFQIMKHKSQEFTPIQRVCVILFDEVHISNIMTFDKKRQQVTGPHKTVQTVMVRSLCGQWKQVVYYKFDTAMNKDILLEIIAKLESVNYTVAAVCSDLGPSNRNLWKQLNIGMDHANVNYIEHPTTSHSNIYFFADAPHLIKLVRNHLFDNGFNVDNKVIDKSCYNKLLQLQSGEFKLAPKLTISYLQVVGTQRQKVKPAVQCLSHSVAMAMKWCGEMGHMEELEWECTSKIIKQFNDWFDIFNVRNKYDKKGHAFGIDLQKQLEVLNDMDSLAKKIKVGKHRTLLPFQRGILLNNKSLVGLYNYLKEQFQFEYILTYRLNQDILENFFSYIRGMGGSNDHPSPLEFKHRLRWYILGKHSASAFTLNTNTEVDVTESEQSNLDDVHKNISSEALQNFPIEESEVPEKEEEEVLLQIEDLQNIDAESISLLEDFENQEENLEIGNKIESEGLKYIAGYVAHKFKNKFKLYKENETLTTSGDQTDWISCISKGGLLHPEDKLVETGQRIVEVFDRFHGNSLSKEMNIITKVCEKIDSDLPNEVVTAFVRTLTYIRLRELNSKIYKLKKKYHST